LGRYALGWVCQALKNRKCAFLFFAGILIFTILMTGLAVRLGQAGIAAVGTVDDVETRLCGDFTTIGTVEDMGHAAVYPEPQSGTRATASTASHPAPAITSISPASNQVGKLSPFHKVDRLA